MVRDKTIRCKTMGGKTRETSRESRKTQRTKNGEENSPKRELRLREIFVDFQAFLEMSRPQSPADTQSVTHFTSLQI